MKSKTGVALERLLHSARDYDTFEVNIFLSGEPAKESLSARNIDDISDEDSTNAMECIQASCREHQKCLIEFLDETRSQGDFIDGDISIPQVGAIQPFWINNSISTEVSLHTLKHILELSDVVYVELDRYADLEELSDAPTDTELVTDTTGPTWSVKKVKAPLLWQKKLNGSGIVVAVLDTGVNYKHPDLKNHMWLHPEFPDKYPNHGYDFSSNDPDPIDEQGHGTACAGIVAGNGKAGTLTGVAPCASIMAVRVGGKESSFWKGMEFAITNKAHVISMSMTWKFPKSPDYPGWRRACETILANGVLHANSIGNQGQDTGTYPIPYNIATPGNCPPPRLHPLQTITGEISSAIACGATDEADALAVYSGRGPAAWEKSPYTDYSYQNGNKMGLIKPDLCAPGPGTTSCNSEYPETNNSKPYKPFGGTSAATPHVGGCLALLAQACLRSHKQIFPARILEALENTAVSIQGQSKSKENHFGAGRVDVYAAYKYGVAKGWWS